MYKVTTYLNDDRMPFLVKEEMAYAVDRETQYTQPESIYELCRTMRMTERATEMVLLLIFDTANHLICISELSTGTVSKSFISSREIAQMMLLSGGVSCVIVHNHPSGISKPSNMDIKVTEQIKEALALLELKLLDHIVVGRREWTSMANAGMV